MLLVSLLFSANVAAESHLVVLGPNFDWRMCLTAAHVGFANWHSAVRKESSRPLSPLAVSCSTSSEMVTSASMPTKTKKGKVNPNKSPPVPEHLKKNLEVEEETTRIRPEHYVIIDDLRYVLPYHFDFKLHAKKRMVGVPIVDLFASEFPVRPRCDLHTNQAPLSFCTDAISG